MAAVVVRHRDSWTGLDRSHRAGSSEGEGDCPHRNYGVIAAGIAALRGAEDFCAVHRWSSDEESRQTEPSQVGLVTVEVVMSYHL